MEYVEYIQDDIKIVGSDVAPKVVYTRINRLVTISVYFKCEFSGRLSNHIFDLPFSNEICNDLHSFNCIYCPVMADSVFNPIKALYACISKYGIKINMSDYKIDSFSVSFNLPY